MRIKCTVLPCIFLFFLFTLQCRNEERGDNVKRKLSINEPVKFRKIEAGDEGKKMCKFMCLVLRLLSI